MPPEAPPETSFEAASELLRHLRHRPADANDPRALAEKFGLPESLVAAVVAGARRPDPTPPTVLNRKLTLEGPRRAVKRVRESSKRFMARPIVYLTVTSGLGVGTVFLLQRMEPAKPVAILGPLSIYDYGTATAALLTLIVQGVLYYRRGMARYPAIGGLVMWLVVVFAWTLNVVFSGRNHSTFDILGPVFLVAMGGTFLATPYIAGGTVLALLGAYARTCRIDRQDEQMSRADLLDRYFDLQKRLEKGDTQQRVAEWLETSLPARIFRRGVWPVALVGNFAIESIELLASVIQKLTGAEGPTNLLGATLIVLQIGLFAGRLMLWITVGLFAGGVGRAIAVATGLAVTGYLLLCLPIPVIGSPGLGMVALASALFTMLISYVVVGFSALAADVQRHNARDRRLAGNDPALLMAEMLRIQWRLAEATSNVCVMVVDAAKSAQMKAEADPLTAEYSFREYQEWMAEIIAEFGGEVTATVGDGAIFEFSDCEAAFRAARRVHTDLDRFNREINRLATPFRLRIGMHIGEVVGDINEVQFTEVIDIAAHVQGAAPIGGIAVTAPVASCLVNEKFIPLADPIDNHPVLIAVESTE
ncbi:adenylate/guanylate cyclase domain-containing protein [bacterium]|nr:MAG: adenylate/guanylate cyclase domain-containing protein [bacterium]